MATENPTLSALEEQVSPQVAEDAQTTPDAAAEAVQNENVEPQAEVDFSDEEAALAASDAGLELDEETVEEAASVGSEGQDAFVDLSKGEMLDRFASMLEEQPVQTLRRTVEELIGPSFMCFPQFIRKCSDAVGDPFCTYCMWMRCALCRAPQDHPPKPSAESRVESPKEGFSSV